MDSHTLYTSFIDEKILSKNSTNHILILSAALNPVHTMHITALVEAKKYLVEKNKFNVVGGYLAPSSDSYVKSKGFGAISLIHRSILCDLAIADAKEGSWIATCKWGMMSGPKTAQKIRDVLVSKYKGYNFFVHEVGGADFALRGKKWSSYNGFICIARPGYTDELKKVIGCNKPNKNFILIENDNIVDISSTKIRDLLFSKDENDWIKTVESDMLHMSVYAHVVKYFDKGLFI